MTNTQSFEQQTKTLIDDLKSVCANYGLGNDGNEFKIITQVFLYKFLPRRYIINGDLTNALLYPPFSITFEFRRLKKD